MGFFEFLASKVSPAQQAQSELDGYAHQRYHARYIVNNRDLCVIEHPKHGMFRVVDLSHHGCLVEPVADASFDQVRFPTSLNLSVCGSSVKLEAAQCQRRRNGWALVFRHVHEKSIKDLGGFIEPLRTGSTAVSLESDPGRDGIFAKVLTEWLAGRFQGVPLAKSS